MQAEPGMERPTELRHLEADMPSEAGNKPVLGSGARPREETR